MTPRWLETMREKRSIDAALALGLREVSKAASAWCIGPCPACGADRRHKRSGDRRGAIGINKSKPRGWKCWQCETSGDALDLVAFQLGGARYRDLSDHGKSDVREWCCRWLGLDSVGPSTASRSPALASPRAVPAPIAAAVPPDAAPATFPPLPEVAALWLKCSKRVDEDAACSSYLRGRGLDTIAIADLELAVAIKPGEPLAGWARLGRMPWSLSRHRCLVKLFDCKGVARSVIARSLDRKAERKSVAPRGHTRAGLVMACSIGKRLLRHGTHPSAWPSEPCDGVPFDSPRAWWPAEQRLTVVICEGEIDFLAWATQPSEAAEHAHATLGIVQGSWSDAIAARIPDGSRIVLAQDLDEVGDKYARRVAETLRGRPIELQRWKPRAAA